MNNNPIKENRPLWGPAPLAAEREAVRRRQTQIASQRERWIADNAYFYDQLKRTLRFIVEPGKRVLNLRCQTGFLLDAVKPSHGVGVDISQEMTGIARQLYPRFEFVTADPEKLTITEKFDYILFDNVSDTPDVQRALQRLIPLSEPHTRLIIYTYNHLWKPILSLAERFHLKMPTPEQNLLSENDLRNMVELADWQWLRTYRVTLFPKKIPFVSWLLNRFVAKLPFINRLCMMNVLVARPAPQPLDPQSVSVSVIIPCKNEAGNIEPAVRRMPRLGQHTEIIFCDDKSTDGTGAEIRRVQQEFPGLDIKLVPGPGIGKAQNVWTGFRAAAGDVLVILDADLTVMPEELPYFFEAIVSGKGEFINGSRLVYPRQQQAMKVANLVGNKFFSMVFSYLFNQRIGDTLCGTKVLWRRDWMRLEPSLGTWGVEDRWGDYEALFGAFKLHLKIIDMPIHYQERVYGTTKMTQVSHHGFRMLRMCLACFRKLKLEY